VNGALRKYCLAIVTTAVSLTITCSFTMTGVIRVGGCGTAAQSEKQQY
jgi:hypothetical protein